MNDTGIPTQAEKLRVLVVDDFPDIAESLAFILGYWGYETAICHSAEEALNATRTFHPRAALLDLLLPNMDGFELARRLKEESPGPIALASITGLSDANSRRRAREAGFALYLVKPIDFSVLKRFLATLNTVQPQQA